MGLLALKSRVGKLRRMAEPPSRPPIVFQPEDIAAMRRIVNRTYADPVRYAARIAIYERAKANVAAAAEGGSRR